MCSCEEVKQSGRCHTLTLRGMYLISYTSDGINGYTFSTYSKARLTCLITSQQHKQVQISGRTKLPPYLKQRTSCSLFKSDRGTTQHFPTMSLATPRILPAHLHAFAPDSRPAISTVRMLGKITAIHGDQATLVSHENQTVTLIMNRYENVFSLIGCCAKPSSETPTLPYILIMRLLGR